MNSTLETYLSNGKSEFFSSCTDYRVQPYKGLSEGGRAVLDLGISYVFAKELCKTLPKEDSRNSPYENFLERCEQDYSKALKGLPSKDSSNLQDMTTTIKTTNTINAFIRNRLFHHAIVCAEKEKSKILAERKRVEQELKGYLDPDAFPLLSVKKK